MANDAMCSDKEVVCQERPANRTIIIVGQCLFTVSLSQKEHTCQNTGQRPWASPGPPQCCERGERGTQVPTDKGYPIGGPCDR